MKTKPKALILAYKNSYLNTTDDAFYEALSSVFDLVFYGPGYIPFDNLLTDAVEIYEKLGPFDVCFVHQYVTHNLHSFPRFLKNKSINQKFHFDIVKFINSFADFGKRYNNVPCARILMSLRTDCYAFSPQEEEEFENFDGYFVVPAPEVIAPVSHQKDFVKENFIFSSTDRYINFFRRNKHRTIPAVHIISASEFSSISLNKKRYLISVPGCSYYERQNVYRVLKEQNYNPVHEIFIAKLARHAMAYTEYKFGATTLGVKFFRSTFKYLIQNSRISFTDGSRVKAPIRKFFEIPAYGTLLAADVFYNPDRLGFVEGSHYVQCDHTNILDVVNQSIKNEDWTQKLIASAQKLVIDKHSTDAWSKYMSEIYSKIYRSEYKGAEWINGSLMVF